MHNSTYDMYNAYKKARRKFALKTYLILIFWLLLALSQWMGICISKPNRKTVDMFHIISLCTFGLSILLFALFLFIEKIRRIKVLAFIIAFLIIELQVIALLTFAAISYYVEVIVWFVVCVLLIVIFVIIGIFLPKKLDFTLHVALLFIMAFVFLLITVFFLMWHLLWFGYANKAGYIVSQLSITIIMLCFVMYHAQTIHGGRFAEMRLNDFCLGSLILFHDFLIIYWLTFYWQIVFRKMTPNDHEFHGLTFSHMSTDENKKNEKSLDNSDFVYNFPRYIYPPVRTVASLPEDLIPITLDFRNDEGDNKFLTDSLGGQIWQDIWSVDESHRDSVAKVVPAIDYMNKINFGETEGENQINDDSNTIENASKDVNVLSNTSHREESGNIHD